MNDTIAAQATPSGRGGVGIIRVSGPGSSAIAQAVLGKLPKPRYADYLAFRDNHGAVIDIGLALYFPAPHSFTGEDVLELHGHGGPVVMDLLLATVIQHGARLARPGEFSERAFYNDKLDLTQAEAIADLIEAGSEQAARAALRSLQGEFSRAVNQLVTLITELRVYVEASIDFAEENIDFLKQGQVHERLSALQAQLREVKQQAHQGSVLNEGIRVVLAGQPNAGKSSVLNALAGHEAAIVTPVAGTTRDLLREEIQLEGMPLHIIDTAGLRDSSDVVEQEGIRRTWRAIERADCVVLVVDNNLGWQDADTKILQQVPVQLPVIVVHNKIDQDQWGQTPMIYQSQHDQKSQTPLVHIKLSALTGAGIPLLTQQLKQQAGYSTTGSGNFTARRRHLSALEQTEQALRRAGVQTDQQQAELVAEELRLAQQALGEITGAVSSDDLLGKIFASFCIGK